MIKIKRILPLNYRDLLLMPLLMPLNSDSNKWNKTIFKKGIEKLEKDLEKQIFENLREKSITIILNKQRFKYSKKVIIKIKEGKSLNKVFDINFVSKKIKVILKNEQFEKIKFCLIINLQTKTDKKIMNGYAEYIFLYSIK